MNRIDRFRYWEPGRYSLTMGVHTNDPSGLYEFEWDYELTGVQEDLIKLNSSVMLRSVGGLPTGNYHFVYADYEDGDLDRV